MSPLHWLTGSALLGTALALASGMRYQALASGAWLAAGIVGQAATLMLTAAGPLVGYQRLQGPAAALREQPGAVVTLLAIVAAVMVYWARHWNVIAPRRSPELTALLVALAGGSLVAAAPSGTIGAYGSELAWAALLQLSALGCVVAAARSIPAPLIESFDRALDRWFGNQEPGETSGPDRFPLVLAAVVVVVATFLSTVSYQRMPHIPDEMAYLIQARYFAAGLPWMAPPPVPAGFETFLLELDQGRWYSVFPPGWPVVLAIGVRLGVPWLVNPLLGGLAVALSYVLVRELSDRRLARLTVVVMAISTWHLFLSMSLMSHTLSLVLALCCAIGVVRSSRTGRPWPAFGAGLALGVLGMSRPLEGVAVGLLAGVSLLGAAVKQKRWVPLLVFGLGTLASVLPGLWYNMALTGSPFVFPAEQYFDREYGPGRYQIGFGPERGLGWPGLDPFPGHGPRDVVVNTILNGFMLNIDLFGWWTGSAGLILLGLLHARQSVERWMAGAFLLVVAVHSTFWFSGGPDFGPRYWYLIMVPCAVLAVTGLRALSVRPGGFRPSSRVLAGAALLTVATVFTFLPWRASDKYYHFRGARADLRAWNQDARFRNAVLLVSGRYQLDWSSALIFNRLDLRSPGPVFAWDRDVATRRAILDAYPDRDVWLVAGPSRTGRGYEVVRGPVPPIDRPSLLEP